MEKRKTKLGEKIMKLIIESKPREGGMREIRSTASILNGEIVSESSETKYSLNMLAIELKVIMGGKDPTPQEILEYAAKVIPRARLVNNDGNPLTTNKVKQTIRHGKDEKGFYSEIISEEQ